METVELIRNCPVFPEDFIVNEEQLTEEGNMEKINNERSETLAELRARLNHEAPIIEDYELMMMESQVTREKAVNGLKCVTFRTCEDFDAPDIVLVRTKELNSYKMSDCYCIIDVETGAIRYLGTQRWQNSCWMRNPEFPQPTRRVHSEITEDAYIKAINLK